MNEPIKAFEDQPVDSAVEVKVSPDKMTAFIEISPPQNNGEDVTFEKIKGALDAAGVKHGVIDSILLHMTAAPTYGRQIEIAYGTAPVDGQNGEIHYQYEANRSAKPKEREDGTVNFWELDILQNVHKGDLLCTIQKATDGEAGMNVLGETVPAKPGKNVQVPFGKNVTFNEDKTEIHAGMDGNLIIGNNQITVDPVFRVNGDVDGTTGNIDFIGSVIITGTVRSGFKVKAAEDVTIHGMVEGASVEAGGKVVIAGGVFGNLKDKIICKGDLKCKFVENVTIRCEGNITCEYMANSDVMCEGEIELVGNRALLVGGNYIVLKHVKAKNIGSETGAKTHIQLGSYGHTLEEKTKLENQFKEAVNNENKLLQIINYLNELKKNQGWLPEDKEDMLKKSIQTKTKILLEKSTINRQLEAIKATINYEGKQSLTCSNTLYRGTKITIKNAIFIAEEDYVHKTFFYDEQQGKIVAGGFAR